MLNDLDITPNDPEELRAVNRLLAEPNVLGKDLSNAPHARYVAAHDQPSKDSAEAAPLRIFSVDDA